MSEGFFRRWRFKTDFGWRRADRRRLAYRFGKFTRGVGAAFSVLVFVASVAALAALIIYGGFDSGSVSRTVLRRILVGSQAVFLISIVFNLVFRFKESFRASHIIKRTADVAMLLTVIPLVWPSGPGPVDSVLHFLHSRYFIYTVLGLYSVAEICYGIMFLLARRTNPSLILSASFLFFIFIGSFILAMPRCTVGSVSYVDSLFMAASAVSMTGLTTIDLATEYTPLGWLVIAVLMQIGALGVLTFTSFFAIFFSGRSSIYNQLLIRDFIYSKSMSKLVPVLLYILVFTLTVEAIGALGVYFAVPDDMFASTRQRIFFAVFHSISGFCNGGFTTLRDGLQTPALFNSNGAIYIVMTVLILAGGIGFPNLVNFKEAMGEYLRRIKSRLTGRRIEARRRHIYDLNTKLVLVATVVLFIGGAVAFFVLEYEHALAGMPLGKKIVQSLFNSATPRTAGFGSMPLSSLSHAMFIIMMFLMWVGCSSQSMGGGIKVNTFMAVVFNLRSIVRGYSGVSAMGRNIALPSVRRANAVVALSILSVLGYTVVIMILQPELPFAGVLFECFSAVTTVGLSLGITPELSAASKLILASAMFLGRVGIISVLSGFISSHHDPSAHLPVDDIIIN
ncbi:MAG: potassium transporter [Muribaculaceae bacterium]|nr:potassium transporter [Muribaculaceae bacterium]